ncbi:MAG: hypothetical protein ACRD8W_07770 [Nitrososphaeraceae archaeon]
MNILDKLMSLIDRDKVVENRATNTEKETTTIFHEIVNLTCDRRKAPKLYRYGSDTSYFLHCFACDKVERVVSL